VTENWIIVASETGALVASSPPTTTSCPESDSFGFTNGKFQGLTLNLLIPKHFYGADLHRQTASMQVFKYLFAVSIKRFWADARHYGLCTNWPHIGAR